MEFVFGRGNKETENSQEGKPEETGARRSCDRWVVRSRKLRWPGPNCGEFGAAFRGGFVLRQGSSVDAQPGPVAQSLAYTELVKAKVE